LENLIKSFMPFIQPRFLSFFADKLKDPTPGKIKCVKLVKFSGFFIFFFHIFKKF